MLNNINLMMNYRRVFVNVCNSFFGGESTTWLSFFLFKNNLRVVRSQKSAKYSSSSNGICENVVVISIR